MANFSRVDQLIIFLKAPRPGAVKTRLAHAIGVVAATAAYRRLTQTLIGQLESLSNVELRFSPDDAQSEIESWQRPGWTARPQGSGDLGNRLLSAFTDAFAGSSQHVVIIGSDCPTVTADDVQAAWHKLIDHDLVIGPATDGGYWLIGLNQSQPVLFQEIAWSTETVLADTLARAEALKLRVHRLRTMADVDTERDWLEFLRREEGTSPNGV